MFECAGAHLDHRKPCELYHSALAVSLDEDLFVTEMAPAWGNREPDRGVVGAGVVGPPARGRSRFFRYPVRLVHQDGLPVWPSQPEGPWARNRVSFGPDVATDYGGSLEFRMSP
jgi:hypothetical protein